MNCGAILLAAGLSRRYGANKMEACVLGVPLLLRTVAIYTGQGFPVIVVINNNLPPYLRKSIEGMTDTVVMPSPLSSNWEPGMGDSLAAGVVRAQSLGWDAALIGLSDMPLVKPETLTAIGNGLDDNASIVPVYKGEWGHPVGFRNRFFSELATLDGDKGGRQVLLSSSPKQLEVDDYGVIFDVDTPEHLEQAESLFQSKTSLK